MRSDGIISVDDSEEGEHLATYDVSHQELLGYGVKGEKHLKYMVDTVKEIDLLK